MRLNLRGSLVYPTLDTKRRLKQWSPSPTFADTLDNVSPQRLQTLLEVARHLLHLDPEGGQFRDTFRDREFWELVYEQHPNLITEDLAEAYQRMVHASLTHSVFWEGDHLFGQLKTICQWEVAHHSTRLVQHLQDLIRRDPWSQAWQDVLESLPDLLPPNEKEHSVEFLCILVCMSFSHP